MTALDTNILVRLIARDDPEQLRQARAQHTDAFMTFDRGFIRRAAGRGRCPVAAPGAA